MQGSPLASWNDGPARRAIVDFVGRVTRQGSPGFVPPEARVAVFDNDGTLWCEKPLPIQADFLLSRVGEMAERDPSLRGRQPWKAVVEKDHARPPADPGRGNSNGDVPMLHFAAHPARPSLSLLVDHDDDRREYAYQAGAEESLKRARKHGWTVVSIRSDWKTVFAGH